MLMTFAEVKAEKQILKQNHKWVNTYIYSQSAIGHGSNSAAAIDLTFNFQLSTFKIPTRHFSITI